MSNKENSTSIYSRSTIDMNLWGNHIKLVLKHGVYWNIMALKWKTNASHIFKSHLWTELKVYFTCLHCSLYFQQCQELICNKLKWMKSYNIAISWNIYIDQLAPTVDWGMISGYGFHHWNWNLSMRCLCWLATRNLHMVPFSVPDPENNNKMCNSSVLLNFTKTNKYILID